MAQVLIKSSDADHAQPVSLPGSFLLFCLKKKYYKDNVKNYRYIIISIMLKIITYNIKPII